MQVNLFASLPFVIARDSRMLRTS